jgi:hypothetical protein
MYLEFVSEDARESTKINVDSIEPALFYCSNECFWPILPHLTLTTSSHEYITHFSIMWNIPVYTVCVCQNQKTSFEEITINYQEQSSLHAIQLMQKPTTKKWVTSLRAFEN